ncbi:hypothetical protein ACET3Z_019074 [Daucus carota]
MPLDLHFLPLKSCKEIVRERQALARMVTYNNIVRKISNFNMDTIREEMMDELSLLEDLDAHGFKVQMLKDRLNKLLMFKSEKEKLKNMLEQRERVLSVHVEENRIFKGTRAKGEERVHELWKEVVFIQKKEKYIDAKKAYLQQNEEEKVKNRGKGCSLYMSWRIACLKRQELRLMRGAGVRKEIELILKMEKNINAKKAFVQQAEGESSEKRGRINMQIEDLIASSL